MARGSDKTFYDEGFAQIAQRAGSIEGFLDEFFDFLHRRTDFYVHFPPPSSSSSSSQEGDKKQKKYTMGFPHGKAEEILLKAFHKHKFRDYEEEGEVPKSPGPAGLARSTTSTTTKSSPAPAPASAAQPPSSSSSSSVTCTAEGKQVPVGNGGVGEGYYWTQSLSEVAIYVEAPPGVRSRDVQCVIRPTHLSLTVAGQRLIEGALEEAVRSQESLWTISQGKAGELPQVVITLEKTRETWWKSVIQGHPEIDTTKVDSTKSLYDYDEQTQAAIRKIVHEQRLKIQGVKTAEELQQEELLARLPPPPTSRHS
eukprot:gene2710-2960_t